MLSTQLLRSRLLRSRLLQCNNRVFSKSIDEIYASSRQYFYYIDKDGRLFLEEQSPKTFITAFKAIKFLDFFWRQIRNNNSNIHSDYEWISHCGKELNFIKTESCTTPIVLYDLLRKIDNNDSYRSYEMSLDDQEQNLFEFYLQFGGSLKIKFDPNKLIYDSNGGRLYHKISNEDKSIKCTLKNINELKDEKYGLIGSHLLIRLSNLHLLQENEFNSFYFKWNGIVYDIPNI